MYAVMFIKMDRDFPRTTEGREQERVAKDGPTQLS